MGSGRRPDGDEREDGGPGRSLLNDYNMHKTVLETASQGKASVCVPRWPHFVKNIDSSWWEMNLARFPTGYTTCNVLCSERIPPLPQEVRNRLIDRYCPPASIATIKANDADRDCLVRPYLGRRKIQNEARRGRNFFSLRSYPLHLNQAKDLDLPITKYAHAMAEILAMLHWTAKIDANDIEFVLAGVQPTQPETGPRNEYTHDILGTHSLWVLDFDCCRPLTMDDAGIEQAAYALVRNDRTSPALQPTHNHPQTAFCGVNSEPDLECSRNILVTDHGGTDLNLPEKFVTRVGEMHEQGKVDRIHVVIVHLYVVIKITVGR
jgi:hypothetical protein